MMLLTLQELVDMFFMTILLGLIFEGFLRRLFKPGLDSYYLVNKLFDLESFKIAVVVVAPAIILHELAHKFAALSFGMYATFHAAYSWLFLGLLMRIFGFPFIFFVPAYVSILGEGSYLQYALIAAAGPFMNLLIWFVSSLMVRHAKKRSGFRRGFRRNKLYLPVLMLTARINLFLFIFNMLPIPGFDGFKFFFGLIKAIF